MTAQGDRRRELGGFIREQRSLSRLSLRRLSQLAGISNPYLSQIERGLRKPSAEILQRIARALSISAETLYVRAGILDERPGAGLVAHIREDSSLTCEQKQRLEALYLEMVGDDRGPGGAEEPVPGVDHETEAAKV
ncbi:MAG TPA: helix-turn-helix transcriptional regulator [Acidimicrobiales bacterium]|nr:helix-turn-helix transcriptional regulator [Acidimicrobiales bacterium]